MRTYSILLCCDSKRLRFVGMSHRSFHDQFIHKSSETMAIDNHLLLSTILIIQTHLQPGNGSCLVETGKGETLVKLNTTR